MVGQFGVVLLAMDFSDESEQAFHIACSIATQQRARLVLLHVIPPLAHGDVDPDEVDEEWPAARDCRKQFERLRKLGCGVRATYRVVVGYPVGMILNVAREEGADLIVIASHQGPQFTFQVHGPVAEGVLRQAHCPVLCLRQPNTCAPEIGGRRILNLDTSL